MRQAGVLAAAGLIALEDGPKRLAEDHANARLLAEALAWTEGVVIDLATVETNIVDLPAGGGQGRGGIVGAAEIARGAGRRIRAGRDPRGDASRREPEGLHRCGRGADRRNSFN